VQLIKRYNLGAHDAAHLASARLNGIGNLVSFDRGWRRVEELDLWNNVIFGDQPES
jgi:predicted nucleic acid-binding protein